jgi:predicted DNA-binding transcriptional regulator AlpA
MNSIQESLLALTPSIERELVNILEQARNHERQLQIALASARLLRRTEAAKLLGMSTSALDRKVASGEIEVVHLDSRPRFELSELKRLIEVRKTSSQRRRRTGRRS